MAKTHGKSFREWLDGHKDELELFFKFSHSPKIQLG